MKKQTINWSTWVVSSILMISDAAILLGVFRLAVLLRDLLTPVLGRQWNLWLIVLPLVQMGILFGISVFLIEGLYPGYGMTAVKELERMSKSVTMVFFFLVVISFLNLPNKGLPRSFLLFSWVLALAILPLSHFLIRNIISRFSWYGTPVVIFGENDKAMQIADSLKRVRRLGWRTKLILPLEAINLDISDDDRFDVAIFIPPTGLQNEGYAHKLNKTFRKVILIGQTGGLGSVWVKPHDMDGRLGLEFHYNLFDGYAMGIKRVMDLGMGLVISILLSPLLLILCIFVLLDSPGPIFFKQERLGKGYKRFNIIKFRTMAADAELKLKDLLEKDPVAKAEYQEFHKLTNDPRLTRIGKWLRRFSLDELPQLVNVLGGSMSVIGPRAYMPSELDDIGDYAPIILRIQPGLTGWWQIMGRHETTFQQRLLMDEYYISNWSLWMDVYILLKTVWVVSSGKVS